MKPWCDLQWIVRFGRVDVLQCGHDMKPWCDPSDGLYTTLSLVLLQCGHDMKPWCDVSRPPVVDLAPVAAMWPRHEAVVRLNPDGTFTVSEMKLQCGHDMKPWCDGPLRVREAPSVGRRRPSGAALATLLELRRLHGPRVQRRWSYGSAQGPV
jgi:CDGSH-type Zn-finger protein